VRKVIPLLSIIVGTTLLWIIVEDPIFIAGLVLFVYGITTFK